MDASIYIYLHEEGQDKEENKVTNYNNGIAFVVESMWSYIKLFQWRLKGRKTFKGEGKSRFYRKKSRIYLWEEEKN